PVSMKYLQGLVPKMAQVFDNTDAICSTKKSGLESIKSKLELFNTALNKTYGLKFKAIDKNLRYYYLLVHSIVKMLQSCHHTKRKKVPFMKIERICVM